MFDLHLGRLVPRLVSIANWALNCETIHRSYAVTHGKGNLSWSARMHDDILFITEGGGRVCNFLFWPW